MKIKEKIGLKEVLALYGRYYSNLKVSKILEKNGEKRMFKMGEVEKWM